MHFIAARLKVYILHPPKTYNSSPSGENAKQEGDDPVLNLLIIWFVLGENKTTYPSLVQKAINLPSGERVPPKHK